MPEPYLYTVGGAVQAGNGLYISRKADEDILRLCRDGAFVYVLYPRQVGKTSLIYRTMERLQEFDIRSACVDLSMIGVAVTAEEWYLGQLASIEDQLQLETNLTEWWHTNQSVSLPQRMIMFFEEVLLHEIKEPVVIFIDEIDATLSLSFTDDYFAAIRAIYNARPIRTAFNRLSFVITGVATPSELISDPSRTPFNIGETVKLDDFTMKEAIPLSEGFNLPPQEARDVLGWILKWSGGHPYLTLRLCRRIVEERRSDWSENAIDHLVIKLFWNAPLRDSNLMFINDMLTRRMPLEHNADELLLTYRKILREWLVADEERSPVKAHLKLSGLVKSQDGGLQVRNLIYREVFNQQWIRDHLSPYSLRSFFRKSWQRMIR